MAKQSKFFRVAVEGDTCDGREISRQDIQDMAATYAPATYTARVNMEHIRGFSASPPFNAYGDVLAVKTEDFEMELGGKTVKKLALLAQIDPTDELVTLNGKRQKLFSSIEINPNFANTKKAYLQGLAVTDSPASLGTEMLAFAAGLGDKNPFTSRKQDPGNFFSAAREIELEFEERPEAPSSEAAGLFAAATEFFKNFGKVKDEPVAPPPPPPPANDNDMSAVIEGIGKMTAAIEAQAKEFNAGLQQLRQDHDTLKASIDTTPRDQQVRQPANGGNGNYARADF